MFKTLLSFLLFFQVIVPLAAQDLTGTWVGGTSFMGGMSLKIELIKCGDHYVGRIHDSDSYGFCITNFEAYFDTATKRFKGKSMGFIDHGGMHSQTNYNLRYYASGDFEKLKGIGTPKSFATKILSFGLPIPGITLTKESDKVDTTEFMHAALLKQGGSANSMATTEAEIKAPSTDSAYSEMVAYKDTLSLLDAIRNRSNPVMKTIAISAATVQIKVYDNGVEDGDSISIVYNNRVLKSQMRVTVKPVSFELTLDESLSDHDITIIAHNLGTIAPNTATVEIRAGEKIYTIRASANMDKNAVIRLKYEDRQR